MKENKKKTLKDIICNDNKINLDNLSDKDIISVIDDSKKKVIEHNKKVKEHEENKITDWTKLLNFIIGVMDEDNFSKFDYEVA